jgi:phi13 family phage major tail protein
MATIGLDQLFYAKITEDINGNETYATPITLAKALTANLQINTIEGKLYADDVLDTLLREFSDGTITFGIKDIGPSIAADLTGAVLDSNGVLVSTNDQQAKPVAIGFRSKKTSGKYLYLWLYRVLFGIPAESYETKGNAINFQTPTIEGAILRRNKLDGLNKHPWRAQADQDNPAIPSLVFSQWFASVYEPDYTTAPVIQITNQPVALTELIEGSISGSLSVTATSTAGALTYQWHVNTANSNSGGSAIPSANQASFPIPTSLIAGNYFYYCVLTAGVRQVTSNVAQVTVTGD